MNLKELVYAILTIVAIVLVIFVFSGPTNLLYASEFFGINRITPQEEEVYENNFQETINNFEKCKLMEGTYCLCEVFETFPGTFEGQFNMVSQGKNMVLSLKDNKKIYFTETVENLFITSFILEDQTDLNNIVRYDKDSVAEKWINFDENPPKFDNKNINKAIGIFGKGEPNVVSGYIFKESEEIFYLILSYKRINEVASFIETMEKCSTE